jgi:hypothetical protein
MPAPHRQRHVLRGPAYENLQGRKPRVGHSGRAASGRMLSYGDLSTERAALMGGNTKAELEFERGVRAWWV